MRLRARSGLTDVGGGLLDLRGGLALAVALLLSHAAPPCVAAAARSLVSAAWPRREIAQARAGRRGRRPSASWAGANGCSGASIACACRCRGRAFRTATPGRSPRATASCCSTRACTSRARWPTSNGRWRCAACAWRTRKLVVCTHAHSDHCGQAATIVERVGCELWMHPSHELMTRMVEDPRGGARAAPGGRAPERRARGGAAPLRGRSAAQPEPGIAGPIAPDRDLVSGVTVEHAISASGWSMRRPATRRRTCACSSPSGAC